MPGTTTRGLLWEIVAPIVRWPLYSPARFTAVAAVLVVAVFAAGRLTADDPPPPASSEEAAATVGGEDTSTSAPSATSGEEDAHSGADAETRREVTRLAGRFARAYVDTDQPRRDWLRRLGTLTTPDLREALTTVDQANVRLGGVREVEVVGVSESAARADVTTGRGALTLDLAFSGTDWQVTRVQPGD